MECIVTARRRPRAAARQISEPRDLSQQVHKIGNLLQAPTEGRRTPAVIQTTPGPIPSPNPSNHPNISKSPTFIYHQAIGQPVEPLGGTNFSPVVLDEQSIEDEGSSVYTAEAVCSYDYIILLTRIVLNPARSQTLNTMVDISKHKTVSTQRLTI